VSSSAGRLSKKLQRLAFFVCRLLPSNTKTQQVINGATFDRWRHNMSIYFGSVLVVHR